VVAIDLERIDRRILTVVRIPAIDTEALDVLRMLRRRPVFAWFDRWREA